MAGALLALAGLSATLALRRARFVLALALAPAAVIGALALLFAEGGFEPYPLRSFVATAAVVLAFLAALPRGERLLRQGGALYLSVCVLCLLVHTQMGSNVERYGVLLAGPLLLCARPRAGVRTGLAWWRSRRRVDRVGPRARDARGGGQRSDARLLLRAARAFPRHARARPRARGGAAHALALGGRAAGAARVARARLGEAARRAL